MANPGDSHQPLGRRRARRCRQKAGHVYTTRATAAHVRRRNKCERPVTRSPEAPLCSVLAAFASSAWPLRNTNGFSVWSRDSQEQGTQPRARGAGDGELAEGPRRTSALRGGGCQAGLPPLPPQRQVRSAGQATWEGCSAGPHVLLPVFCINIHKPLHMGEETMGARPAQEDAGSCPGAGGCGRERPAQRKGPHHGEVKVLPGRTGQSHRCQLCVTGPGNTLLRSGAAPARR